MRTLNLEDTQKILDFLVNEILLTSKQAFDLIYQVQESGIIKKEIEIPDTFEQCEYCDNLYDSDNEGCYMSIDYIRDCVDKEEQQDRLDYCLDKFFCSTECESSYIQEQEFISEDINEIEKEGAN